MLEPGDLEAAASSRGNNLAAGVLIWEWIWEWRPTREVGRAGHSMPREGLRQRVQGF